MYITGTPRKRLRLILEHEFREMTTCNKVSILRLLITILILCCCSLRQRFLGGPAGARDPKLFYISRAGNHTFLPSSARIIRIIRAHSPVEMYGILTVDCKATCTGNEQLASKAKKTEYQTNEE